MSFTEKCRFVGKEVCEISHFFVMKEKEICLHLKSQFCTLNLKTILPQMLPRLGKAADISSNLFLILLEVTMCRKNLCDGFTIESHVCRSLSDQSYSSKAVKAMKI